MPIEASGTLNALPDRYTVVREIGRGGMAVVYLAHDRHLDRKVAVKVLRHELTESLARDRFVREIRIEANLQHPNVLPIFDSGEVDGLLFYTMPYVEGESLADRLKREGQLSIEDSLRITKEVAQALTHAHERGIVHRDIKPGNILLAGEHAMVADFGIARAFTAAGGEPLTKDTVTVGTPTGVAIGTPEYMSPEQVAGDSTIDGRSDQYALACVLFEMLAGDPPFAGRTLQSVIGRQLSEPPPSLVHRRPKAPRNVTVAVDRALSKVAADRYRTMEAFVKALETPIVDRASWWKAAAVAAMVLLASAGIWFLGFRDRELDLNRIVVFPTRDVGDAQSTVGHQVATYLGWVLEGTEPLRWVRGRDFMSESQMVDPTLLSVSDAARIARDRQAGYFVDGDVLREPDSVTVVLRLFQTGDDTPVRSAGASGPTGASEPLLGAVAIIELVSEVIAAGRNPDKAGLSLRSPAAVTNFLLAEEEYRRSHFSLALDHYSDAVAADSMFSLAAIRGAQAASWLERADVAELLTTAALAHDSLLPIHYSRFARGLASYFAGAGDSAVAQLRSALADRGEWPEAWMALGEVFYHLLPDSAPLDSLAEDAFRRARMLDSAFSAPLYHLTEIAGRRGQLSSADSLARLFFEARPDSSVGKPMDVMRRCWIDQPDSVAWVSLAEVDHAAVFEAAGGLAKSRNGRPCATYAFHAVAALAPGVFDSRADEARYRFAAKYALQSLLLADERFDDVRSLYEGDPAGPYILWQDALEFDAFVPDVADLVASFNRDYDSQSSTILWLLGVWEARYGSAAQARRTGQILTDRGVERGAREDSLFGAIVTAHATLAEGDSLAARDLFLQLRPIGRRPVLGWGIYEALGLERLTLTRLLVARGEYEDAIHVASAFDSPQPISYLMYRPRSLQLRITAAEAIGDQRLANRWREELAALRSGRGDG